MSESFERRFDELFALAMRPAWRILGDRQEAENVAAEVLARALEDPRRLAQPVRLGRDGVDEPGEWTGLFLLLLVLLGLISVLPGGTVLGALVAGTLAGTLVTLMVLLRKLDLLRWHEQVTIWEPTTRLFRSMGSDPYVPRQVIDDGRYRPTGRVRVVDYPDTYPIRATKVVKLEYLDMPGSEPEGAMRSA